VLLFILVQLKRGLVNFMLSRMSAQWRNTSAGASRAKESEEYDNLDKIDQIHHVNCRAAFRDNAGPELSAGPDNDRDHRGSGQSGHRQRDDTAVYSYRIVLRRLSHEHDLLQLEIVKRGGCDN
jgi:hypothetical protein